MTLSNLSQYFFVYQSSCLHATRVNCKGQPSLAICRDSWKLPITKCVIKYSFLIRRKTSLKYFQFLRNFSSLDFHFLQQALLLHTKIQDSLRLSHFERGKREILLWRRKKWTFPGAAPQAKKYFHLRFREVHYYYVLCVFLIH